MAAPESVEVAAEVVVAYVSNNPTPMADLTALILAVYAAVERLGKRSESTPGQVEAKTPAVPLRNSVTPEYLICLEDGKKLKSLRRHLGVLGLTPEQYRAKWSLPSNYPMVAPNYSNGKSAIAKRAGLGQKRKGMVDQKSVQ
jgi:predicted transcriptional regulator